MLRIFGFGGLCSGYRSIALLRSMPLQKRSGHSHIRSGQPARKGHRREDEELKPQRIRDSPSSSESESDKKRAEMSAAAAAAAGPAESHSHSDEEDYSDDDMEECEEDSFSDFFGEEDAGETEEEDSTDYSDDSSVKTNIAVNFDARSMFSRHVDGISGMIDSTIPDGDNLVDRHDFGLALKQAFCTTLITVTQIEEDDASDVSVNTADPMDDEDIYGVASFVHVGSLAAKFPSCAGIHTLFARAPETHVVAEGTAPGRLLKGTDSRAVLFFNDHLNVVPPHVIGQVHESLLEEFKAVAGAGNAIAKGVQHIIFLARVQRINGEADAKNVEHSAEKKQQPKAKKSVALSPASFDLRSYEFPRWEDEVYFKFADSRLSVPVYKFPRYIESQAEVDIPRCVMFGVPLARMQEAVKAVASTAQKLASMPA